MDIVHEVFGLFALFGDHAYGEAVTQREHALQAAHFARVDGAPDALVAAALLHDVGQFLHSAGEAAEAEMRDGRHEDSGATFLARYFPPEVVEPIRLHVAAKRYLCAMEPDYHDGLSEASQLSLRLQGGIFSPEEAAAFRAHPYAEDALQVRRYDDLGKQADLPVEPLEAYRPLLEALHL